MRSNFGPSVVSTSSSVVLELVPVVVLLAVADAPLVDASVSSALVVVGDVVEIDAEGSLAESRSPSAAPQAAMKRKHAWMRDTPRAYQ
jgi:hypothetical protein